MAETKHDKFLRLAQNRLERALEDFRLISQLASSNYRNTPEEAYEVVYHLDRGIKSVAQAFGVQHRSWIAPPLSKQIPRQLGQITEVDAAKAIAHIQSGDHTLAIQHLQAAINKDPR